MLAKAACLVAALVSVVLSFKPPPSSKTVDPKKEQKVVSEISLLSKYANKSPLVMIIIAVLETSLYLALMINCSGYSSGGAASGILKGSSSLPLRDHIIFQEMAILKTWQKVATVFCLLGYALRKWSFITLDRFFTYELTIRTGHKLVQTGPYTYLRHPSYTGAILNSVCFYALIFQQGLWNVFTLLVSRAASAVLQSKVAVPTSVLGVPTEYWNTLAYALMILYGTAYRVRNEEAMLKSHFGKDWDVYASKRWRFIPFVY